MCLFLSVRGECDVPLQVRLNGGTNIASAVAKAGSLLKADEDSHSSNMRRVLVLLTGTDGLHFCCCR